MQSTTKPKPSRSEASDKPEGEMSESTRNRAELDARLDKLSASRINLSIAAAKPVANTHKS